MWQNDNLIEAFEIEADVNDVRKTLNYTEYSVTKISSYDKG